MPVLASRPAQGHARCNPGRNSAPCFPLRCCLRAWLHAYSASTLLLPPVSPASSAACTHTQFSPVLLCVCLLRPCSPDGQPSLPPSSVLSPLVSLPIHCRCFAACHCLACLSPSVLPCVPVSICFALHTCHNLFCLAYLPPSVCLAPPLRTEWHAMLLCCVQRRSLPTGDRAKCVRTRGGGRANSNPLSCSGSGPAGFQLSPAMKLSSGMLPCVCWTGQPLLQCDAVRQCSYVQAPLYATFTAWRACGDQIKCTRWRQDVGRDTGGGLGAGVAAGAGSSQTGTSRQGTGLPLEAGQHSKQARAWSRRAKSQGALRACRGTVCSTQNLGRTGCGAAAWVTQRTGAALRQHALQQR